MTQYLLDTCTLIWLATEPEKLSITSAEAIDDPDTVLLWSDVSSLEIALKWSAGKLVLPDPPRHWLEGQIDAWGLECLSLRRTDIFRASGRQSAEDGGGGPGRRPAGGDGGSGR